MNLAYIESSLNSGLIKETVAAAIREEIISGRLEPGEPVVEGKWAPRLGVAQTSIRAGLNILESEGFVQRGAGRSLRVTSISAEDVVHIFRVRVALEALAARLLAERRPGLSELDQIVADMRSAVECRNLHAFYERDLRFHLTCCRLSGNTVLEQTMRRLLIPLFAFVIMRTHDTMEEEERSRLSVAKHEQIVASVRSGNADLAVDEVTRIANDFFVDINELTLHRTHAAGRG